MSRLKQLEALRVLLAGELPQRPDWPAIIALANLSLVTPQIYAAARRSGAADRLPGDVRTFLAAVWRRNRRRNRRLFQQLREAVAVLNAAGLHPTLLKGAAHWATLGCPAGYDRVLTDLDILTTDPDAALAALSSAGFLTYGRSKGPGDHVTADLGRPHDPGVLELHNRPPGPEAIAKAAIAWPGQSALVGWNGVQARLPSPELQVFLLVLHDQFQDGGYWRGDFVLRHLIDIADLTGLEGFDWSVIDALSRGRLLRNTTHVQLLAAAAFAGATTPRPARRPWARLQHARMRAQFGWPPLRPALALLSG